MSNHAAHSLQNSAGRGCISGVLSRCNAPGRKEEEEKTFFLSTLISKKREGKSQLVLLVDFPVFLLRLTVFAQHSLALPETHRNTTALHLPVDLPFFFSNTASLPAAARTAFV